MAANVYECLFILDSNRYARDGGGITGTISEMVEKVGGEVLASRLWMEQKLAYPVNGHRKGVYWLTYFRLDSSKLTEFNRACQLNEAVVRHLVLKHDPRLVEALVNHALGGRDDSAPSDESEGNGEGNAVETTEEKEVVASSGN